MSIEEKNLQTGEPPVDTPQASSEIERSSVSGQGENPPETETVVDTSTPQTEESKIEQNDHETVADDSEVPAIPQEPESPQSEADGTQIDEAASSESPDADEPSDNEIPDASPAEDDALENEEEAEFTADAKEPVPEEDVPEENQSEEIEPSDEAAADEDAADEATEETPADAVDETSSDEPEAEDVPEEESPVELAEESDAESHDETEESADLNPEDETESQESEEEAPEPKSPESNEADSDNSAEETAPAEDETDVQDADEVPEEMEATEEEPQDEPADEVHAEATETETELSDAAVEDEPEETAPEAEESVKPMHFGEDPNEDLNAAFAGLSDEPAEEDEEEPETADEPEEDEVDADASEDDTDAEETASGVTEDEGTENSESEPEETPAAVEFEPTPVAAPEAKAADITTRTRRRQQRPGSEEPESSEKKKKTKKSGEKSGESKKMNWKIPAIIVGVLAAIYLIGVFHFSSSFMPGTYIDGFAAVNKSPDTITEEIKNQTNARSVELVGMNDETMTVQADQIDLSFQQAVDYNQILEEQNPWSWPIALLGMNRQDYNGSVTYSHHKLDAVVADSPFVQNTNITETVDAKAVYQDGEYVIQDEVYGDRVNQDALKSAIVTALSDNVSEVNLEDEKVYVQPNVTKDNETLKASVAALNKDLETVITYKFGDDTETLDKDTFATWLSTDSHANVSVDKDKVAEYVEQLAEKYDTLYTSVPFTTSSGSTVDVYALGYGWEIDQESETDELYQLLESGTSQSDREPVYLSEGADRSSGNAIGDDYIEISISDQTMWCYKDGQLVVSTPVTTGTAGSYDTPVGLYEIQGMDTNVTLRGEGYASPVTYWIPFNGGIGIHDASWRSSYGGTVYLSSGSHGCVNTPYAAVETIFENAYVGEPVVVY